MICSTAETLGPEAFGPAGVDETMMEQCLSAGTRADGREMLGEASIHTLAVA